VAATGGLPLAYQWQLNGTNLADGGNISGSSNTNLVISSVSTNNVGTYTVTVTNFAASVTSSNALLTITPSAPVIFTQPTNQTVVVGFNAQFTVTAVGTKPLAYQWSCNTTNIVGATNATLTLSNVQFTNAGAYVVTVTNSYGSTNSLPAVLTVLAAPPCDPPPAGLVSWWSAEGSAADLIGGSNGVVEPGTSFAAGVVGQCFNFNGVNGCVLNTNTSPLTNIQNSFTMEFWAYPKAGTVLVPPGGTLANAGQQYAIFPSYGENNAEAGVGVSVGTNGISVIESAPFYLPSMLNYTNPLIGWIHVAVVYSNMQPALYVNGVKVATGITSTRTYGFIREDWVWREDFVV
jgi:hypothetical protein